MSTIHNFLATVANKARADLRQEITQAKADPQAYVSRNRALLIPMFLFGLFFLNVAGAFAAPPPAEPATLNLDTEMIQTGLFQGANIILGALGVVMFLMIGMKFGGIIIRAISSAIDGLRI